MDPRSLRHLQLWDWRGIGVLVLWVVMIFLIGAASGYLVNGCSSRQVSAGERVEFFDTKGRRTGSANVDRKSGYVDFYDSKSNRIGWGKVDGTGRVEQYDLLKGQRQGTTLLPLPVRSETRK